MRVLRTKPRRPEKVQGGKPDACEQKLVAMEITDAAKSGDGTVNNVGVKMNSSATHKCPDCRQTFDTAKAKQLHWKFIHDPNRHQED